MSLLSQSKIQSMITALMSYAPSPVARPEARTPPRLRRALSWVLMHGSSWHPGSRSSYSPCLVHITAQVSLVLSTCPSPLCPSLPYPQCLSENTAMCHQLAPSESSHPSSHPTHHSESLYASSHSTLTNGCTTCR